MNDVTRILIVEDHTPDFELAQFTISNALDHCEFERAETRKEYLAALKTFEPDLILSDYALPNFDGMKALKLAQIHLPLTPVIIWTGSTSEDTAVDCMRAGAVNYVLKENTKRLAPAVVQALKERTLLLERKRAEEKYQSIFENSPVGVFQSTPQGQFLSVNAAMARIYRYDSPQEMINSINDIAGQIYTAREDRHEFTRLLEEQGIVHDYEWKNIRRDGSVFWTSTSARVVRDAQGQVLYYEGFLQDITQRKQAEENLVESEKRFRSLIEHGMDSISLLAADGTLVWENPATYRDLGYGYGEFLGRNIFGLMHPEDTGWTTDLFSRLVHAPGSVEHGIFRLKHHDGGWRWIEATATNMLEEPSVRAIVINYRDISERKNAEDKLRESQQKYQNLVETSHDLIWAVDADGRITYLNRAAKEIYGYEPEELIGRFYFELLDPEHSQTNPETFKAAIENLDEHQSRETYVRYRDGRKIILSTNSIVLRDENGNLIGVTGSSRDVTEQKRAEQALLDLSRFPEENPNPILRLTPAGQVLYANSASQGLLDEWNASIGRALPEDWKALIADVFEKKDKRVVDAYIHNQIYSILVVPIQEANYVNLYGRDVTEQKQAEELLKTERNLLRTLVDNLPDRIYVMDIQGRKTLANTADWKACGGKTMEDVIGKTDFDLYPRELAEPFWQLDKAVLDSGMPVINYEEPGLDFEGNQVSILTTKIPLRDQGGNVIGLVGVGRDITERKQTELERQTLFEIMQGLAVTDDLQEFLRLVHGAIGKVIHAENFFVILHQRDSGLFEEIYSVDQYDPPAEPFQLEKSITAYIFRSGEPLLLTQEYFDDLVEQGEIELIGTNSASWLGAPLKTSNGIIGVIGVQDYIDPHRYSERDKELLASIASQIALAVERKQSDIELKRRNDDLALLNAVNDAVMRGQNLDAVIDLLARELKRIYATVGSTVYMISPDRQSIVMQQYAFAPETANRIEKLLGFTIPRIEIPIKEGGHFHKAMISRRSAITSDPEQLRSWIAEFAETKSLPSVTKVIVRKLIPQIYKLLNIKSTIIIPLLSENEVIGFLDVSSSGLFTTNDLIRIEAIGAQLTTVIQRQQVNEKIRESEERFRLLFENSGEAILITQPDGSISSANPEACRMFGRDPDEIKALGRVGIADTSDPRLQLALQERSKTGQFRGELRLLRKDGSTFPAEVSTTVFKDSTGNEKTSMIIRDITERRRAEAAEREQRILAEALRDSSQILSSTLDYGEVLDQILATVGRVVPHDAATITLIDGEYARVVRSQGYEKQGTNEEIMGIKLPLAETTNLQEMLATRQPVIVYDTHSYAGWKRMEQTDWLRSSVGAPISIYGEVIGFILLDGKTPSFFTPVHAERLEAFANQAALAIHNARLLQQAQDEIAERKQVEASLHAEREKVQNYLDIAGVILLALDQNATVTLINQKGCEILGFSSEEIIGRNWIDTFLPDVERAEMLSVFQQLISGHGELVGYYENEVLCKSGERRLIAWHNTLVRDAQGKIISTLSSGEDITERKRAEQELRASEERFRQLADNIQEVFWMTDAQTGEELYMSPASEKIWGFSSEYLMHEPDAFVKSILEDDVPTVLGGLEKEKQGEKVDMEYRIRRADGSVRWVWDRAFPVFDENGTVKILAGIAADITERKQAEIERIQSQARYQDLFDSSPISLWEEDYSLVKKRLEGLQQEGVTDLEEYFSVHPDVILELASLVKVIGVNRASLELYNARHQDELLRSLPEFVSEETLQHFQYEVQGLMNRAKFEWEGSDQTLDGKKLIVMVHGSIPPGHEADWSKVIISITDITERKQTEEALRESEERFGNAFEFAPIGIALVSLEGQWVKVNQALCDLLGYTQGELTAKTFQEITYPEDLDTDLGYVDQILKGERSSYQMEKRYFHQSGSIVWALLSVSLVKDRHGRPQYFISQIQDITERKLAEERVKASEERYHSLFQHLTDGFALHEIITDEQGKPVDYRILEVNPAFEKLTGLVAQNVIGRRVNEVLPRIENERFIAIYGKVALTGQPIHFEEFNASLGRHYEINAYSPRHGQFAITFVDVTERKQAEADLRKLSRAVEQSASTIVITDIQGNIEYVNPTFTKTTGYSYEEAIGANPRILKTAYTSDAEYKQLWETIKAGREWHGEFQNRKKNGDLYWEFATISPVLNEHGEITHFLAVKEDISQRKQSEEEIRRRAQETSALLEISLALTNLDLKSILESIGNSAHSLFAADGCRIFLVQPDGETLRCVLALEEDAEKLSNLRLKIGEGVTGSVAASGRAEIVNEMQSDPRAVQVPGTEEEEEESIMFAPLKEQDRTIGVLSVRRAGGSQHFDTASLELLEAFASMAASAVSKAGLLEETQRRLTELEALYENGLAVGQLLKQSEIGGRIIETFARHLSWHHVTIRLLRPDTDELELIALNLPGLGEEEKLEMERHFNKMVSKVGQGLSGSVVQTGIPLRTGNVHAHPEYVDTQAGIESGLYMPLKIGHRAIGVISVESQLSEAFTEQDERLLATMANQAAIAFENARLYQAAQQEIAERNRAQAALWASETHYRELADSITDILFEMDHNLHYTHWNKASEMFSGIPAAEAVGRSMQDIFGASEDQIQRDIYLNVLKERQAKTFESQVLVDGQKRTLEITAYPSARGIAVVAKDVTDRKLIQTLMQKRFELMEYSAHHSLDDLMQKMIDEVSEFTNSHIGFLHFVEEDEETLNLQAWSTETVKNVEKIYEKGMHYPLGSAGVWADALRQRRSLIHNDYASLPNQKGLPEGHIRVIRELVIPIIRDDRIVAVLGVGNKPEDYALDDVAIAERFADYAWDITERKRMESALADEKNQLARRVEERTADLSRANSNLARALRVKDEFLANMSHELRTPLNAILGLSESLSEQVAGPLNEKQQKYLNTINESGHHLLALINDILDLAKIEAGQITLDINKVDVNSVCQAGMRMIKQLAQRKNQDVQFAIDDDIGLMWADERRLKQMIVNLLSNAVKFTPESGALGLEARGNRAENKVIITVWDKGIGISQRDLERLFRPFVQLDSGLAREATGTGLGLALVAQMARLHGGSVHVTSEPGQGSRFMIELPWEPALAPDTSIRLRSTGKFRAIKPNETNKPTILLIEDTREVVMMLMDYLEMAGYKIVTAQDGVEGLSQAKLNHPDLILMDIQMPRMDGFETTQKLRLDPEFKETPIIALTALAMASDRQRCIDAGMDEYMSKPVNLKALAKTIQKLLFENQETTSA